MYFKRSPPTQQAASQPGQGRRSAALGQGGHGAQCAQPAGKQSKIGADLANAGKVG